MSAHKAPSDITDLHAENLAAGMRVRALSRTDRHGTHPVGTIVRIFTDNTATPPRPVLSLDFDGGSFGMNYPEQCILVIDE